MTPDWSRTTLSTTVPFDADGRHFGDLRLLHSDNRTAAGYIPVPLAVLRHGPGPTLLLTGGTHGDEYEGTAAILRLVHDLDLATLRGRIIALPALNAPAFYAATRVSPIDHANLNRVFPGSRTGSPTEMIAHCMEHVLIPVCDAVIDLHSGGKASFYVPSVLVNRPPDAALLRRNLALARVFGAELLWVLGGGLQAGSVNGAAARQGVPMVATELGGGGTLTPAALQVGIDGIRRVMIHLGMCDGAPPLPPLPPAVEAFDGAAVYAPTGGVFEPHFAPGQAVVAGSNAGRLYPLPDLERPPIDLVFPADGIVIARVHRGLVERGEKLAFVGRDAGLGALWQDQGARST
jgi:predicted deacylase